MFKSPWPGVRRKRAKGKTYWYWTRVAAGEQWAPLPDPYADPDAFMRRLAHLKRVAAKIETRRREGTFGAVSTVWRQSKQFSDMRPRTRVQYDRYLDRLLVAYADAPLAEITPEDIQVRVMDANADTPAAANMMLAVLRAVNRFAIKRQRGVPEWTKGIDPYPHKSEHEPWPAHALRAALDSDDDLFRLAVALHLYTGQRTGDACAMTWRAADSGIIWVKQEKTGEALDLPLHPNLKAELARAKRHGVVILTNKRGAALSSEAFRIWCRAHGEKFGLRLVPHGLRKNAANELFEAGCTAAQVAAVTGHRSMSMLEHYGKKRSQPKLAHQAIVEKWGAKTEQERENLAAKGKPGSKNG